MAKTFNIKLESTEIDNYIKRGGLTIEPNKLWLDADRNLAGDLKATFVGIFPKIKIDFRTLTESEMKIIENLLDAPSISVTYWDSGLGATRTADFYAGDYEKPFLDDYIGRYSEFSVNLIPFKKR